MPSCGVWSPHFCESCQTLGPCRFPDQLETSLADAIQAVMRPGAGPRGPERYPSRRCPTGSGTKSRRVMTPGRSDQRVMRKLVTLLQSPTACSSQTQTPTTTTTFRIDLIDEAIGMNRLIRYNATPT